MKSSLSFVVSLSSFILCLFASVLNTNCDVDSGFDDFKIERLVLAFECLSWLVCYPDLLLHIFTQCTTLTGRRMTLILRHNSRHFSQVLLSHILVTPLQVQLCHLSFAHGLSLKKNESCGKSLESRARKLIGWISTTSKDGILQIALRYVNSKWWGLLGKTGWSGRVTERS